MTDVNPRVPCKKRNEALSFLISLIVAVTMIWVLFGDTSVLNPSYVDWMAIGDLGAYHLCSIYYAADEWRWPLGLNPNYGAGFDASITQCSHSFFFSLADKALTHLGLLNASQQHHGYIILTNLTLQFFVAFLIFRHLLGKERAAAALLIALLFTQMPELLERNRGHVDLGAHYIILLGIYAILAGSARLHLWFFLIALLAVFTHAYLFGMVFGLYCLGVALEAWRKKALIAGAQWHRFLFLSVGKVIATVVAVIAIFYAASGMATGTSVADSGYGFYRSDLLTFFDPNGSIFLGDLPSDPGEYEGSFYIGVGFVLILVALVLVSAFSPGQMHTFGACALNWRIIAVFCLLCTLYAVSNRISIGPAEFVIRINAWEELGSLFRSSGRFIWLPGYILCIAATYYLAKALPRTPLFLLLVAVNVLQFAEMSARFTPRQAEGWSDRYMESMKVIKRAGLTGIRTMQPGFAPPDGSFFDFAYPAALAGLSVDQFYLARTDMARAADLRRERLATLVQSAYEPGFAYLIPAGKGEIFAMASVGPGVFIYRTGDYVVISRTEIPGLAPIDAGGDRPRGSIDALSGIALYAVLEEGWGDVEAWGGVWSVENNASVTIPQSLLQTGQVSLRLVPIGAHAAPAVSLALRVICPDETPARTEGPNAYICNLSGEDERRIVVSVDTLYSPHELSINGDTRRLGVSLDEVRIIRD